MPAATVLEWKRFQSGAVIGVIGALELPSGMVLHGCLVFSKDGRRWVSPPSKIRVWHNEVQFAVDGKPCYDPVVTFVDRAKSDAFSALALEALDAYLAGGGRDV